MRSSARVFGLFSLIFFIAACDKEGDTAVVAISNSAKLTSSTLSTRAPCSAASARCTPTNISGDICFAFLGMGDFDGGGYVGMTWLAPEASFPDGPDNSAGCSTVNFDLSQNTQFSGKISVPASEDDMPATPKIFRAELNYNYVDVKFSLTGTVGGAVDDTYTVRTVYGKTATATDVDGTMQQGDKLILPNGDTKFKWCNATTCSTDRTAVATGIHQDPVLTTYHDGGKYDESHHYIPVVASMDAPLTVDYATISDTNKLWTLDFAVTDGIEWEGGALPSTFANERDIVDKFHLKFAPNQNQEGTTDDGVKSALTITDSTR